MPFTVEPHRVVGGVVNDEPRRLAKELDERGLTHDCEHLLGVGYWRLQKVKWDLQPSLGAAGDSEKENLRWSFLRSYQNAMRLECGAPSRFCFRRIARSTLLKLLGVLIQCLLDRLGWELERVCQPCKKMCRSFQLPAVESSSRRTPFVMFL